MSKKIIK